MAVSAGSPSAYSALKNLKIIQLPFEKQVKMKVPSNSIECGIDEKAIQQQQQFIEPTKEMQYIN